jgi:CheY-like chemotaxis protein
VNPLVLVVDDEPHVEVLFRQQFRRDLRTDRFTSLELLPKAKALRPDVPVIMITAYGDAETKRKALENGAEALFTKRIDFATLRSEIDMRVERAA